jgi:hypothetical protein
VHPQQKNPARRFSAFTLMLILFGLPLMPASAQQMSGQSLDANGYTIHTGATSPAPERLRITQAGLVGIATTAPSSTLTISGSTWTRTMQLGLVAGGEGTPATGSGTESDPQVNTLTASKWCVANAGGTAIDCTSDAAGGTPGGNNTEVQFNSSGSFGASSGLTWNGTTLTASNLSTGGALSVTGAATLGSIGSGAINASGIISGTGLNITGDISYTGILTDVSDRRAKDNIVPLGPGMLDLVKRLQPVAFTMKGDSRVELGFIAQDVDAVLPDLVAGDRRGDGPLALNYNGFIAPLAAATQELAAKLDALEAKVEALRAENAELRARLENQPTKDARP